MSCAWSTCRRPRSTFLTSSSVFAPSTSAEPTVSADGPTPTTSSPSWPPRWASFTVVEKPITAPSRPWFLTYVCAQSYLLCLRHCAYNPSLSQDWIRGKIPFFVAPPEPDTREANGKPLPRPLKVSTATSDTKSAKKSTASGGTNSLSIDGQGNTVKAIKGVTQPLHQIVHSTKFLADDNQKIDEDTDEEEVEDAEEDEEEWGGIGSEGEDDDDEDDDEEDESFEAEFGDAEVPLQWDQLFEQAVGDAESGADSDDEDVELVMDEPGETPLPGKSAKAQGKQKKSELHFPLRPLGPFLLATSLLPLLLLTVGVFLFAAIDDASSDDEAKPVKEKRMTTNKKKAESFYTHANVKNKSRRGAPGDIRAGGGKGSGKKRSGRKSNV